MVVYQLFNDHEQHIKNFNSYKELHDYAVELKYSVLWRRANGELFTDFKKFKE